MIRHFAREKILELFANATLRDELKYRNSLSF